MRNRNRRWLLAWTLASLFPHIMLYEVTTENAAVFKSNSSGSKEMRGIFAPRMNYEQWTPLGRGDPLKNDPTYDYVPPVLDRVHYWIDPASRKPDAPLPGETQKTEILVLGVSSKRPSTGTSMVADSRRDTYDPFLKFVEGPKFGIQQNNYQRMSRPHYSMSSAYYPSPSYMNKNKNSDFFPNKSEQRVPYTMLMPPPAPGKRPSEVMSFQQAFSSMTTTEHPTSKMAMEASTKATLASDSSYTIQQSNLLYHSSTLGSPDEFRDKHQFGTLGASSSQVTWRTPYANPPESTSGILKMHQIQRPESYMEIKQTFPKLHNLTAPKTQGIANIKEVTTMTRDNSQIMHKGQVTDDDMDISNTYVNIGKPEAQMDSPTDMEISSVSVEPPRLPVRQPPVLIRPSTSTNIMHSPTMMQTDFKKHSRIVTKPQMMPMTLQTLQTMQTMKAPPVSQTPIFVKKTTNSLHELLQKESTLPASKFVPISSTKTPPLVAITSPKLRPVTVTMPTTTPSPTTTTTTTSLTTDPLFKHYKQPTEPLRGPMYLIIQGHSKVKTYGPGKQIHGITVQETNEIPTSEEKDEFAVKHLHGYNKKDSNEGRLRQGRSSKLQTLSHVVQTGLGAIEFSETAENRRKDDDVQEAELVVRYDVSSQTDATSERYFKGIVEAGDMARNIKDAASAT